MKKDKITIEFNESFLVMIGQTEGVTVSVKGECEISHYEGSNEPDDESEITFSFSKVFMCYNEVCIQALRLQFEKSGLELTPEISNASNVWIAVNTDFETEFAYSSDKPHLKGFIEQVKDYCLEAAANYDTDEN
jgi:hypothetical protein